MMGCIFHKTCRFFSPSKAQVDLALHSQDLGKFDFELPQNLGGGFKYFLFSTLLGEDSQFD